MEPAEFLQQVQRKRQIPHTLVLEHVSPATRLLEKRRQIFEVQEALEQQKQDYARKEEVFRRREEGLKKKDLELQASLIRFSKFLQENDAKRARALRKAADERKQRDEKQRELDALLETTSALKAQREQAQAQLQRNLRFQHYLEAVLEAADEFHEIPDIIARHAMLEALQGDLRRQQHAAAEAAEAAKAELHAFVKAKGSEILGLNNALVRLKKEVEEREAAASAAGVQRDARLQAAATAALEHGQVCTSAASLFHRVRGCSHVPRAEHASPLAQLEAVGNFVADLQAALRELRGAPHQGPSHQGPPQPLSQQVGARIAVTVLAIVLFLTLFISQLAIEEGPIKKSYISSDAVTTPCEDPAACPTAAAANTGAMAQARKMPPEPDEPVTPHFDGVGPTGQPSKHDDAEAQVAKVSPLPAGPPASDCPCTPSSSTALGPLTPSDSPEISSLQRAMDNSTLSRTQAEQAHATSLLRSIEADSPQQLGERQPLTRSLACLLLGCRGRMATVVH
ncbi:hypothetical protein WJX81_002971 [Elliptochloris bilobata]|uniref:DUF4200 domain-containing protein n=1 Tax=Elliptochloris bilobata TaxID=381761 RepID=A0AAW1S0W9_9CHLO